MTTEPESLNELVPLSLISTELGEDFESLAARLVDDVHVDDVGLRAVAADVARRVIADHRREREEVAEALRRQRAEADEIYEQLCYKLPRRPTAAEIEAAGYGSAQEYMAAQMHADAERAGTRRTSVLEDALAGGLVYRPVGDGGDR